MEEPRDFLNVIEERVNPTQGREIYVEKVEAVYDWTEWFSTLGIHISGITSTNAAPEVNHSWRVVRRGDLPKYAQQCQGEDEGSWSVRIDIPDSSAKKQTTNLTDFDVHDPRLLQKAVQKRPIWKNRQPASEKLRRLSGCKQCSESGQAGYTWAGVERGMRARRVHLGSEGQKVLALVFCIL